MNQRSKGFLSVLISSVVFGMAPFFISTVYAHGAVPSTATALRFIVPLPVLFGYLKLRKTPLALTGTEIKKIVILSVFGYVATALLLLISYRYISGGLATTLHFVYPLFIIVAGLLFFRQPANKRKLLSAGICLAGIALVGQLEGEAQAVGIVLALCSAATYAFYTLYLEHSGLGAMDSIKLAFFLQVFGGILALLWCVIEKTSITDISLAGLGVMGSYSLAFTFFGVVLFQLGVRLIGPESTALLSTLEPVTSILAGWLLLDERIGTRSIAGCVLVLVGVLIITMDQKNDISQSSPPKYD